MQHLYKNKIATSLALVTILTFNSSVTYALEVKNSNFLTNLFSVKTLKVNQSNQKQIYKSDINSLKLDTLIDFEFSIQDILKNYLDKKNINNVLNNIYDKDDKNLNADSLDQFDNLLPKSKTDKINGKAIIRLAKKLGKDEKTIFEIKKNIILQVLASQDISLVYNEKPKKTDVAEVDKDDDIDTKEASSSNMPVIAGIAGLGALGGGGGGSSGSTSTSFLNNSTTFTENSSLTTTWQNRQEYKNADALYSTSTINPYTLVGIDHAYGRGLSGNGKVIAIMDSEFSTSAGLNHIEFAGKTITKYGTLSAGGPNSTDYHGVHVAGTLAANYNNNNSSFVSDNSGTYTYGIPNNSNLSYGMMGVAYNASLHLSDFNQTSSGSYLIHRALATDDAKSAGAIVQNNSWGNSSYEIDDVVNYKNNNSSTNGAAFASFQYNATNWDTYATALDNFQQTGVIVRSSGNESGEDHVSGYAGMPLVYTDLAEAWLTVGNLDFSGSSISSGSVTRYSNKCGIAAEFCIYADGYHITSAVSGYGGTSHTGEYQRYSGSSMSGPIVAGSIALLSEAFPNHTPAQLVDRVLASANNDFFTTTGSTTFSNGITHGYNEEFGHGLLDLDAALKPIDTSSMIVGDRDNSNSNNINSGRRYDLLETNISLPASFGDSFTKGLKNKIAYFYDGLNGGFPFYISSLINETNSQNHNLHHLNNNLSVNKIEKINENKKMSFYVVKDDEEVLNNSKLLTYISQNENENSFFSNNVNIQNTLSFSQRNENLDYEINNNNPLSIPFLNSSENGISTGHTLKINDQDSFVTGFFTGKSVENNILTSGLIAEYSKEVDTSIFGLFFGLTSEKNGLLESSINGAFGDNTETKTQFIGLTGFGWLTNKWSYNSMITSGYSKLKLKDIGLINEIDNVVSSSFSFGVSKKIDDSQKSELFINFSQPMRVENGNASISIPKLYETGGNLLFESSKFKLSPSGRQLDLSIGYNSQFNKLINTQLKFSVSDDLGHVKSNKFDHSLMLSASYKF